MSMDGDCGDRHKTSTLFNVMESDTIRAVPT
jgi:hypothetical protein